MEGKNVVDGVKGNSDQGSLASDPHIYYERVNVKIWKEWSGIFGGVKRIRRQRWLGLAGRKCARQWHKEV